MRNAPVREVEHKRRVGPGPLLTGLAAFAASVILLWGIVRTYELQQENLRLEEELSRQEDILSRLQLENAEQGNLLRRAEALGLRPPEEEQVVILHLRGKEKEHTGR